MAYKNDIFISYRRNPETLEWINNHFVPLLALRLGFELRQDGRVLPSKSLERIINTIYSSATDTNPFSRSGSRTF